MKQTLRPAIVALLAFTVLFGLVYPLVMDAIAAVAFPHQATGSLIRDDDGRVVGSELIGQPFDGPAYFWPRPSATSPFPNNAGASAGSNLGPTNP
ncbi:MAG TPA: potassium-transporting ATPase subunit C, partial [Kofleriaceae bacterium]|nr:potassium-transporting ATPase subunit C [Kofleriaceae bacterium]